jgi:hypothetical protein
MKLEEAAEAEKAAEQAEEQPELEQPEPEQPEATTAEEDEDEDDDEEADDDGEELSDGQKQRCEADDQGRAQTVWEFVTDGSKVDLNDEKYAGKDGVLTALISTANNVFYIRGDRIYDVLAALDEEQLVGLQLDEGEELGEIIIGEHWRLKNFIDEPIEGVVIKGDILDKDQVAESDLPEAGENTFPAIEDALSKLVANKPQSNEAVEPEAKTEALAVQTTTKEVDFSKMDLKDLMLMGYGVNMATMIMESGVKNSAELQDYLHPKRTEPDALDLMLSKLNIGTSPWSQEQLDAAETKSREAEKQTDQNNDGDNAKKPRTQLRDHAKKAAGKVSNTMLNGAAGSIYGVARAKGKARKALDRTRTSVKENSRTQATVERSRRAAEAARRLGQQAIERTKDETKKQTGKLRKRST